MKGIVSVKIIMAVAAVMIAAVVFLSGKSLVDNIFEDKEYFEAKLTLLGLRDNMILASTLDSGEIKFLSLGSARTYRITIDEVFMSLKKFDDKGDEINMPPVAPLPHYTPEVAQKSTVPPYVINAKNFCIIKRQESPACGPVVEVCELVDERCSCQPSLCK